MDLQLHAERGREDLFSHPPPPTHPSPIHAKKRLYHRLPRRQNLRQMGEVLQEALAAAVRLPKGRTLPGAGGPHRRPSGQALAVRARPTAPTRSGAAGGHQGNLSPGHRAPPRGWAEAKPSHGPVGGPGSVEPMAGQGRAVRSWRLALLRHGWGRDSLLPLNTSSAAGSGHSFQWQVPSEYWHFLCFWVVLVAVRVHRRSIANMSWQEH